MVKPRYIVQLGVALLVALMALGAPLAAQASPGPVTIVKHANLGFTTSVPINEDTGVADPPCLFSVGGCLFHGAIAFSGTLTASVTLGTDVALTYDPADLNTPNGPLPVSIKYTPTPNGSTVSYSLSGNMTFNFDGCTDCPKTLPFNASSAPNTFTAPMGSDSPVTIPGSSSGITLNVARARRNHGDARGLAHTGTRCAGCASRARRGSGRWFRCPARVVRRHFRSSGTRPVRTRRSR